MRAIVLLSGGLDSTVVLAKAKESNRDCIAISFDYGQRHAIELNYAKEIAKIFGVPHKIIKLDVSSFANSSLVSDSAVPKNRTEQEIQHGKIPNTYVPARNTLFISYALAQAEIYSADEIHLGPNLMDKNGYPDCRPEYIKAFQALINLATRQSIEQTPPKLITPLIEMDKKAIVKEARRLGVPVDKTFSCYDPTPAGAACKSCDACLIRLSAINC